MKYTNSLNYSQNGDTEMTQREIARDNVLYLDENIKNLEEMLEMSKELMNDFKRMESSREINMEYSYFKEINEKADELINAIYVAIEKEQDIYPKEPDCDDID